MSVKYEDCLTWSAVNSFGGRKIPGRVSIIVDTQHKTVYLVPRETEHKDYLCEILRTAPEQLRTNPRTAANFIPVHIDLTGDCVEKIIVGLSGAEEIYGIRHPNMELTKAADIARRFVYSGQVPYSGNLETKIDYRYAERNSHRNL